MSEERSWVCVWDAGGSMAPGTVFRGAPLHAALTSKGVVALPITPLLVKPDRALAGYFIRQYGDGGAALSESAPKASCPMVLDAVEGGTLHWAVALRLTGTEAMRGQLALMGDSRSEALALGNASALRADQGPQAFEAPGPIAVVRGQAQMVGGKAGLVSLALWGWVRGARALWAACSQTAD